MFESAGQMLEVQRQLSKAQAFPVAGPIIASPVKAVISLAEIVGGLASTIIFGVLATLFLMVFAETPCGFCVEMACDSLAHLGLGILSFGYSVANMCTLGLVGYRIEYLNG